MIILVPAGKQNQGEAYLICNYILCYCLKLSVVNKKTNFV